MKNVTLRQVSCCLIAFLSKTIANPQLLILTNNFLYQLFGCLMPNFGSLSKGKSLQTDANHSVRSSSLGFLYCGWVLNPFQPSVPFSYPLKRSESLWFSEVFRGCKMENWAENGLILSSVQWDGVSSI